MSGTKAEVVTDPWGEIDRQTQERREVDKRAVNLAAGFSAGTANKAFLIDVVGGGEVKRTVTDQGNAAHVLEQGGAGAVAHIDELLKKLPSNDVLPMTRAEDLMICHQCDFAGCTNAAHMRLGTNTTNRAEYFERRGNLAGPLADVRGAAGRTRAIAAAIRTGLANHEDAASIEKRIRDAEIAGLPLTLW